MFLRSSYKAALAVITLAFAGLPFAAAKIVGTNTPAESITRERISRLPPGQRSAWMEYLERSERHRKADKEAFHKELKNSRVAQPSEPPHGYGARSMPLDHDPAWYAKPDALRIADNMVSFQTPAGGWGKNLDLSKGPRVPGERYASNNESRYLSADDFDAPKDPDWNYIGTIDNDATISEITFLAKVISAKGVAKPYLASFLRAVHYLVGAQFPNGGWPQVYPLEGGYHDAITYNDNATVQVLTIMHRIANGSDSYPSLRKNFASRPGRPLIAAFNAFSQPSFSAQVDSQSGHSSTTLLLSSPFPLAIMKCPLNAVLKATM